MLYEAFLSHLQNTLIGCTLYSFEDFNRTLSSPPATTITYRILLLSSFHLETERVSGRSRILPSPFFNPLISAKAHVSRTTKSDLSDVQPGSDILNFVSPSNGIDGIVN